MHIHAGEETWDKAEKLRKYPASQVKPVPLLWITYLWELWEKGAAPFAYRYILRVYIFSLFASTIDEVMLLDDFYLVFLCVKIIVNHLISHTSKDACAELIAYLLERPTHGIVAVQKRSCFKNTQALPFSLNDWNPLQYMKELWVLYIIEHKGLTPLLRVFHLSCNKHVLYNRSLFGWVLGFVKTGERKADPAAVSILRPPSATSPPCGKC